MIICNSYPVKIIVNGTDLSHCVVNISVSNSGLDFSGLVKTTGYIDFDTTLYSTSQIGNRQFFDPRKNKSFWKRGRKVSIQVSDALGQYRDFERGNLRLAGLPVWSYDDDIVQIPVCCELCHFDISEPDAKFTSVKLGTNRARTDAINVYFQGKGITSGAGGMNYPLKWNINNIGGSGVATCGNLAFESGYALYIDPKGIVQSFYILGTNKTMDIDVKEDAIEYDVVKAQNYEFDRFFVTAEKIEVKKWDPPPPIIKDVFNTSGIKIGSTRTEYLTQSEYSVFIDSTRGLVYPKSYPNGDNTLIRSEEQTFEESYQQSSGKKLIYSLEKKKLTRGVIAPKKFPADTTLVDAYEKRVEYVYNLDEIVIEQRTVIRECKGLVFPDDPSTEAGSIGDPADLIDSFVEIKSYEKYKDQWYLNRQGQDIREGKSLSETQVREDPPQTKRRPNDFYTESSVLESVTYIAGENEGRDKRIQVGAVTSTGHLDIIAKTYMRVISSNNIVNRITLPYPFKTIATPSYYPYFNVNVIETYYDGTSETFTYYCDAHSFNLSQTEHTISMDLCYAGLIYS